MALSLFGHPFSSYCQKVEIALYENETPFAYRLLTPEDPATGEEWARLWPLRKMPVMVDGETSVFEATSIVEHLSLYHPGPVALLPMDARGALPVRTRDRFFDNYIHTPMQKIVADHMRSPGERDPRGVADAKTLLSEAYRWLDREVASEWACGADFTLADCAAAPSLFYADWVHEIPADLPNLRAYRARLLARPSVARAVDEARPYRHFFPPGAPDRD